MSLSDSTKAPRRGPSPMMLVSIGIGTALAVILISIVSILTNGATKPGNSATSALPTSALVGTKVKSFTLSGLNGGTVSAPWATGHATVVIFFASYCGPCRHEMPKVAAYLRTHNLSPIEVVGVDASDLRSSAQSFVRHSGVDFRVGFDPNDTVTSGIFKFVTIPETAFVNARGVVTKIYFGAIPTKQLVSGLKTLKVDA